MAELRLEHPQGGELVLDGSFADLSEADKETWLLHLNMRREAARQKEKDRLLDYLAGTLDDTRAAMVPSFFAPWDVGGVYNLGDRVNHGGLLYKCLQGHKAQADWEPGKAVSLWVRIDDPKEEWPPWRQPQGAHDAYKKGDKVSHKDKRWTSTADSNVWEPGVFGWEEVKR